MLASASKYYKSVSRGEDMKDLVKLLLKEKKLTKEKSEAIKMRWASKKSIKMPLSSDVLKLAKSLCTAPIS